MSRNDPRSGTHGRRALRAAALIGLLGGCQAHAPQAAPANVAVSMELRPDPRPWQAVITADDRQRLARIGTAWSEALAGARRLGHARRIAAEGALLDPAAALPRAEPAPGPYRCRIIRLGGTDRRRAFTAFEPFFCHVGVEDDQLNLTKQTGSERQAGFLWDDEGNRMIFLGALATGAEAGPPAYGASAERDLAGVLERVGAFRYRLVMPRPREAGTLDVLELVPAVPPELGRRP